MRRRSQRGWREIASMECAARQRARPAPVSITATPRLRVGQRVTVLGKQAVVASATTTSSGDPFGMRARGKLRDRAMNRNERAYAAELERRRASGEIKWWEFEGYKLRLADNTHYTPDFAVLGVGDELEFHEAKGRKGDSYWCEDDAKKSIKFAAACKPHRFLIVWRQADGSWAKEVI